MKNVRPNNGDLRWTQRGPQLFLLATFLLTYFAYQHGLDGGYLFDDFPNIVENNAIHVTNSSFSTWWRAAMASPSPDLRRPLAMVSFGVNEYFTGDDPFPMKLTNLAIHLLNGFLLYLVTVRLFRIWAEKAPDRIDIASTNWLACFVSAAWLLAPINLSTVLYVVQRMESIANLFVLFGLWQYLEGRRQEISGEGGEVKVFGSLIFGTGVGLLAKESAVQLVVYTILVEATLLKFRTRSIPARRRLIFLYCLFGLVAFCSAAFLLDRIIVGNAFANRSFSLEERLLTEPRVLIDYARWILLPSLGTLGFYHDEIKASTSLFTPYTSALAILGIILLVVSAAFQTERRPLYSLGILWYFSAHLLTATFIPLELVFEHRNYFASAGLLLALTGVIPDFRGNLRWITVLLPAAVFLLFGFVTRERAKDWADPVSFAFSESKHHPDSPRAVYELGQTLIVASHYKDGSPLVQSAIAAFDTASHIPGSGILPEAALIIVAGHTHARVDQAWWQRLIEKLNSGPASEEDISGLNSLFVCQLQKICASETHQLLAAFLAALSHTPEKPRLLGGYSDFVETQIEDYALSESLLKRAIMLVPTEYDYQISLLRVLIEEEKFPEARLELAKLENQKLQATQLSKLTELRSHIL